MSVVAPWFGSQNTGVDCAIREDVDHCVEVESGSLRRVPAMAAKARQHSRPGRWQATETGSCRERRRRICIGWSSSRSRRTVFLLTFGLVLGTRSGTSPPRPLSAQPPQPRLRSPRQFTTRSDSPMPSMSESAPYHNCASSTGRREPQNSRKIWRLSPKPRIRRSRWIASCTRRTVSNILVGSSEPREEWDVESCAPSFQRPIIVVINSPSGVSRDVICAGIAC